MAADVVSAVRTRTGTKASAGRSAWIRPSTAVEVGHVEVEEDDVGVELGEQALDLPGVGGAVDLGVADAFQDPFEEADVGVLVVDDEDSGVPARGEIHG